MIIKKYVVNSMNEAVSRIRNELGKDAVIVSQRKIRKPGIKGIFSRKVIEVTATVDNKTSFHNNVKDSIDAIKEVMEKKAASKSNVKKPTHDNTHIVKEMQEMKKMLSELAVTEKQYEKTEVELKLEQNDINDNIIKDIVYKIKDTDEEIDENEKVKEIINEKFETSATKFQDTIVLVGPTGVGKTTTIAKLAGRLSLMEKKKVGLITIDTYRIGAVEQLRTYADIMKIPFKVIISPKEMELALNEMKDCDVVLIDTTGRSSKNKMQIAELNSFIDKTNTDNIHLVISCTTKNNDIKAIIEGYRILNFNKVVITKLDETTTYGSILNILYYAKKPLSFVTVGQNVPDDMKVMTKEEITKLILGEGIIC